MLNARLSHIALGSADLAAATRFYEDQVGLTTLEADGPTRRRLGLGSASHVLELTAGAGLQHFALEVAADDLGGLADQIRGNATDLKLLEEMPDHPDGLTFLDPDGHRVVLHSPVKRRQTPYSTPRHRPLQPHHIPPHRIRFGSGCSWPQINDTVRSYAEER